MVKFYFPRSPADRVSISVAYNYHCDNHATRDTDFNSFFKVVGMNAS